MEALRRGDIAVLDLLGVRGVRDAQPHVRVLGVERGHALLHLLHEGADGGVLRLDRRRGGARRRFVHQLAPLRMRRDAQVPQALLQHAHAQPSRALLGRFVAIQLERLVVGASCGVEPPFDFVVRIDRCRGGRGGGRPFGPGPWDAVLGGKGIDRSEVERLRLRRNGLRHGAFSDWLGATAEQQRHEERLCPRGHELRGAHELGHLPRRREQGRGAPVRRTERDPCLHLGPVGGQSRGAPAQPAQHPHAARPQLVGLQRVDHAGYRVDGDLARPGWGRLRAAPFVLAVAQAEQDVQVLAVLLRERGAQLVGGEQPLLDERLAVPLARLVRRLLRRFNLQRVDAVGGEQHVRQGAEAREAGGAAHVARAEERADLAGGGRLDGQGPARPRPEHRRHQLGDGGLAQVALRQRGEQLEGVHGRFILSGLR